MRKIIILTILLANISAAAQDFCERKMADSSFYYSSTLSLIGNNLYHFLGISQNNVENRNFFLLKADHCLNIIDSVMVPLDSGVYRTIPFSINVGERLYALSYASDIDYFDQDESKYKNELFVYDSTLSLIRRVDISGALAGYNFLPSIHSLGDSLLLVTSSNRSGTIGTALTMFDLQGNKLDQITAAGLLIYSNPVGSSSGRNDYFISAGRYKVNFSISPFQLTTIDTINSPQQHSTQEVIDVLKILPHQNGSSYLVASCRASQYGSRNAVSVYRLDSQGIQTDNLVYGKSGRDDYIDQDIAVIATNGDIVIGSYIERFRFGPTDLEITRLDQNLNIKWQKIISLKNIPFISLTSSATPYNGATFISLNEDSTYTDVRSRFNDLHYLHIDSTGYYSPLSTDDFNDMLGTALTIYPNPVSTSFTLSGLNANETYQAAIYDLNGNQIRRFELSYPFEVDVSSLPAGSYLLDLQDVKGIRLTKKFVIK